ncbi:hypothetical protein GYMLUDRAFT_251083 [Collybiopsis luxurians FD-317 M1]|uniref:Unplaced genomic scaffold GYMLUscaffold_92, whole genome shotgun sequence n=1 Tax=Collybiopsis luxurians FD-317 M1 TaxID=944289 RepID=A0A0D0BDK0_9AGAR|nr:hypothetical protein GYMLUDRAFT_251083 [Collybiopsis luxurians FD-317 M1]
MLTRNQSKAVRLNLDLLDLLEEAERDRLLRQESGYESDESQDGAGDEDDDEDQHLHTLDPEFLHTLEELEYDIFLGDLTGEDTESDSDGPDPPSNSSCPRHIPSLFLSANPVHPTLYPPSPMPLLKIDPLSTRKQKCQARNKAQMDKKLNSKFTAKQMYHRRGDFVAQTIGYSHGGGQTSPSNTKHTQRDGQVLETLLSNDAVQCVSGLVNSGYRRFCPEMYAEYQANDEALRTSDPTLRKNFPNSVFAATTFNLGPQTITPDHVGHGNNGPGGCTITSAGYQRWRACALGPWYCHSIPSRLVHNHPIRYTPPFQPSYTARREMILYHSILCRSSVPIRRQQNEE